MRTITKRRGMLVGLAVLAAAGTSACSANRIPGSAGPGAGQVTAPAATASAAASSPGEASSTPNAPGGIQNLVITSAEKSNLTAAYVAMKGISLSDVGGADPRPGSVYYAYDPATDTYWAMANFGPSSTASLNVQVSFQDGGEIGMFRKAGSGTWQVHLGEMPPLCGELAFFPQPVLAAWSIPTSPPAGMTC